MTFDRLTWWLMKLRPHLPVESQEQAKGQHVDLAELSSLAEELTALNLLGRKVSASLSLEAVVASALDTILGTVKCDLAFLFLREGEGLVLAGIAPETGRELLGQIPEHRVGECMCGLAVRLGQPLYSRDIFTDVRCTWEECKKAGLRSFAALPLRGHEAIIGVVGLASRIERDFAPKADFLETMAGTVASSLQNARLFAETKRVHESLRTSEEHFRRTFDLSPVGAVIVGADFRFLRCNEAFCQFVGYSESELKQKTFIEVTFPEDRQIGVTEIRAILADQMESARVQKRYLHQTGRPVWGDVSIRLVKDQDDRPIHLLAVVQDITGQKRADEALRESEAKLRAVFEGSRDAIGLARNGMHIFTNPAYVELFGFKNNEELVGSSVIDLIAPCHRQQMIQNVRRRSAGQEVPRFYEMRCQKADGREFDAEFSVSTFKLNGEIHSVACIRDITERKRAANALKESEVFRKRVFESSRIPIVVLDGETLRCVDCNRAAVEIYRIPSREAMIGKTPADVASAVQYDGTPSLEKALYFNQIARTKGDVIFEWRNQYPDGGLWDAEIHLVSFASGGRQFFQLTTQDVTARKRAEEALRESEEHYRLLFRSINDAVFVHGLTGSGGLEHFFDVNELACQHLGYTREELLELDPAAIDAAETHAISAEVLPRLREDRHAVWEGMHVHKDGHKIPVELSANLFDYRGKLTVVTTVRDITERKKAEEALRESQASLEFAQSMARIGSWDLDFAKGTGRWSKEMFRLFGRDPALGVPCFTEFIDLIHPEDRAHLLEAQERVAESRESCQQEFRTVGAGGSIRHFVAIIQAVKESSGPVRRVAGAVQDITERKQAEQKQRELEAQMQQAQKLESLGNPDRWYRPRLQ